MRLIPTGAVISIHELVTNSSVWVIAFLLEQQGETATWLAELLDTNALDASMVAEEGQKLGQRVVVVVELRAPRLFLGHNLVLEPQVEPACDV